MKMVPQECDTFIEIGQSLVFLLLQAPQPWGYLNHSFSEQLYSIYDYAKTNKAIYIKWYALESSESKLSSAYYFSSVALLVFA